MDRISKDEYYLDIAKAVSARGTCLRRNYGAVIVKDDEIISTGYNGAPRGEANCCDEGWCLREVASIPHGERYELCRSVHAEQNAIISASRKDMINSIMYLSGHDEEGILEECKPCIICRRLIKNAGIKEIIMLTKNGIQHEKIE